MVRNTSHDQTSRILIVDYPRQGLGIIRLRIEAAALDDNEMRTYQERYRQGENRTMATLSERFCLGEGMQKGPQSRHCLPGCSTAVLALWMNQWSAFAAGTTQRLERWRRIFWDCTGRWMRCCCSLI